MEGRPCPFRRYPMPGPYGQVNEACRRAGFAPDAVKKDVWLTRTGVGLVRRGMALVPASLRSLREGRWSTERRTNSHPRWGWG